jgi:hypothetical protein
MARQLPASDEPVMINGQICKQSESAFLAANPRANSTGSVTVAGTVATGDVLQIIFTGAFIPGGPITVAATAVAGDTDQTMAEKLAAAIEANAVLQGFGVTAYNSSAVVHVTWPGPIGTHIVLSTHTTGAETFTTVQLTGGSGPIIPNASLITGDYFRFVYNGAVLTFVPGRAISVASDLLSALLAAQAPIT